jgi:hypothetical protein
VKLYKFVARHEAVINMAKGNLKFTPIDELNDPLELFPDMVPQDVEQSLRNIRDIGLTPEQFDWLGCQQELLDRLAPGHRVLRRPDTIEEANRMLSSPAYDNLPFMRDQLVRTIHDIRRGVGVLSLSARWDSLAMWAHYANDGKGFVVVLRDLKAAFPGDATGSLNKPKRVRYSGRFEGMTFDPASQDNLFFWKHQDWSYEKEWRVVLPLSDCPPQGGLHLRRVDTSFFAGVILGHRVKDKVASSLKAELAEAAPHATVQRLHLNGPRPELIDVNRPN